VPGTDLAVQSLTGRAQLAPTTRCLVLVLEGQVIVDLPGGRFHVLDAGHSLQLPEATAYALQSVGGTAILLWHSPR